MLLRPQYRCKRNVFDNSNVNMAVNYVPLAGNDSSGFSRLLYNKDCKAVQ